MPAPSRGSRLVVLSVLLLLAAGCLTGGEQLDPAGPQPLDLGAGPTAGGSPASGSQDEAPGETEAGGTANTTSEDNEAQTAAPAEESAPPRPVLLANVTMEGASVEERTTEGARFSWAPTCEAS